MDTPCWIFWSVVLIIVFDILHRFPASAYSHSHNIDHNPPVLLVKKICFR
jgi:hypothetical protein